MCTRCQCHNGLSWGLTVFRHSFLDQLHQFSLAIQDFLATCGVGPLFILEFRLLAGTMELIEIFWPGNENNGLKKELFIFRRQTQIYLSVFLANATKIYELHKISGVHLVVDIQRTPLDTTNFTDLTTRNLL